MPTGQELERVPIVRYALFAEFVGWRLLRARMILEAWIGHGLKSMFERLMDVSLLIQSIH